MGRVTVSQLTRETVPCSLSTVPLSHIRFNSNGKFKGHMLGFSPDGIDGDLVSVQQLPIFSSSFIFGYSTFRNEIINRSRHQALAAPLQSSVTDEVNKPEFSI